MVNFLFNVAVFITKNELKVACNAKWFFLNLHNTFSFGFNSCTLSSACKVLFGFSPCSCEPPAEKGVLSIRVCTLLHYDYYQITLRYELQKCRGIPLLRRVRQPQLQSQENEYCNRSGYERLLAQRR